MSIVPVPLVSLVVVSWNTREELQRCLASVVAHAPGEDLEIIVVDNDSRDTSVEMLRHEFPAARVIVNDTNRGFAAGCNQGMAAATGRLILLLNSDTYVVDDVIDRMARQVIERSEIGMAACQLRYPNGRVQHSAFRSLSIARSLFEDLWLYKFVPDSVRDNVLLNGYWDCSSEKEVDWLAGAFLMLRREVYERTGGFDEGFFMYGEDSEWCARVRRAGFRIFYSPLGVVYHVGCVSSDQVWGHRERLRRCHLGGFEAYAKLHGGALGLAYKMARLVGSGVRSAAYSILMMLRPNDYYRVQRQLYRWQMAFALEALRATWTSRQETRRA